MLTGDINKEKRISLFFENQSKYLRIFFSSSFFAPAMRVTVTRVQEILGGGIMRLQERISPTQVVAVYHSVIPCEARFSRPCVPKIPRLALMPRFTGKGVIALSCFGSMEIKCLQPGIGHEYTSATATKEKEKREKCFI